MSNLYFGADVDQAIVLFRLETDLEEKHKIFINDIKPAFEKLVKYHFYRTPINKDPEIMHDCLSFLYEQIEKFDYEKHKRGFPYFNVIAKHFFIQKFKNENKKKVTEKNTDSLSEYHKNKKFFDERLLTEDLDEAYEDREFMLILREHLPKWRDQFQKEQEILFVDALISIFDNVDKLDDMFKKKAVYVYLKEITGLNSKQIGTNLTKIKKKFFFLKKKYLRGDI